MRNHPTGCQLLTSGSVLLHARIKRGATPKPSTIIFIYNYDLKIDWGLDYYHITGPSWT